MEKIEQIHDQAPPSKDSFKLVRKSGVLETLFGISNDLAVTSNIVVAAEYYNKDGKLLDCETLLPALRRVVHQHPALTLVAVDLSLEGKGQQCHQWEAQLKEIDLERCVELIQGEPEGPSMLQSLLERTHNEWFPQDGKSPRWKLKVINGRWVMFVYDHLIADGLSGCIFHHSLQTALHSDQGDSGTGTASCILNIQGHNPPKRWWESYKKGHFRLQQTWGSLKERALQFLFPPSVRYSPEAVFDPNVPEVFPGSDTLKPKTVLLSLRLPYTMYQDLLAICREKLTSFPALLHTVISITLAADIYPQARFGVSTLAVNLRPLTTPPQRGDLMMNCVSSYTESRLLSSYRAAANDRVPDVETQNGIGPIRPTSVWRLAAAYKKRLKHSLERKYPVRSMLALCQTELDKKAMKAGIAEKTGKVERGSFVLSCLGDFNPEGDAGREIKRSAAPWYISRASLSSGASKAAYGNAGMRFYSAGTREGDHILNVTFERGVLRRSLVQRTLNGIRARLYILARNL